jgi:hypothetical protein
MALVEDAAQAEADVTARLVPTHAAMIRDEVFNAISFRIRQASAAMAQGNHSWQRLSWM